MLKHAEGTNLALTIPFDGEPINFHRLKSDFIDRMKNVGLKAEFNVKVGENRLKMLGKSILAFDKGKCIFKKKWTSSSNQGSDKLFLYSVQHHIA
jgi:hypothetical protein